MVSRASFFLESSLRCSLEQGEGVQVYQWGQEQCGQEARFHYKPGLLAGSPKAAEWSQLRSQTKMPPPCSEVRATSAEDGITPEVTEAEKPLEGIYWASEVAEGDAGGGSFPDHGSDIPANICESCAEGWQC